MTATQAVASPFRETAFLRYAFGEAISSVGDQIWIVGAVWTIADVTSAGLAGLVISLPALPQIAAMFLGGPIADRFDARRMLIATELTCALVMAVAAVVLRRPHLPALIVIALTLSTVYALISPAVSSVVPRLLHPDQYGRATALRTLSSRGAMTAGAFVGGVVMAAGGITLGCAVDSATFVCAAFAAWTVHPRPLGDPPTRTPYFSLLRGGVVFVARHRVLRGLIAVGFLSNLGFVGPVMVGIALVSREHHWGSSGLAATLAVFGLAAALSAAAMTRLPQPARPGLAIAAGTVLQAAGLATMIGTPWLAVTVAGAVLLGLSVSPTGVVLATLIQKVTPDEYRGRVGGVQMALLQGVCPATVGLTGLAASAFGTTPALLANAAVTLSASVLCLALPDVRRATQPR